MADTNLSYANIVVLLSMDNNIHIQEYPHHYSFLYITKQTGLMKTAIRRSCRKLARMGFAQYAKGLMNEDGEVRGAGYCITPDGARVAAHYRAKGLKTPREGGDPVP